MVRISSSRFPIPKPDYGLRNISSRVSRKKFILNWSENIQVLGIYVFARCINGSENVENRLLFIIFFNVPINVPPLIP